MYPRVYHRPLGTQGLVDGGGGDSFNNITLAISSRCFSPSHSRDVFICLFNFLLNVHSKQLESCQNGKLS